MAVALDPSVLSLRVLLSIVAQSMLALILRTPVSRRRLAPSHVAGSLPIADLGWPLHFQVARSRLPGISPVVLPLKTHQVAARPLAMTPCLPPHYDARRLTNAAISGGSPHPIKL
ncbi:hypothetical protein PVAP13_3NG100871 [Panicum virgatum]|uniref:Uncharacterized protein n=1 Tax=Panicum virgatum TaxID=38727 RepID=A0A8T0UHS4_PANVG|nr:hypothetical protein PVAP13_3NG100871 [Panicum virgatum]